MARFTLVVRPDGRALLTTAEPLSEQQSALLLAQLREWEAGTWPITVVTGCDVVQIGTLELDLDPKPAEVVG
jgi:hypothetical protein